MAALALVAGAHLLGVTALLLLLLLALLALTTFGFVASGRTRRWSGTVDPRFLPTDEVFHDPSDGTVTRVHVDPKTGERRYGKVK